MAQEDENDSRQKLSFTRPADDTLIVFLSGRWKIDQGLPSADEVAEQLESGPSIKRVAVETRQLTEWDSALVTFLIKLADLCSQHDIVLDKERLPGGVHRLLDLASSVPEREGTRKKEIRERVLVRVGEATLEAGRSCREIFAFVGEAAVALLKFLVGKASFRRSDLIHLMRECGIQALPIVSLLSLLVGMILGFLGLIQLKLFGAELYVADLVGIGMVRLMSPIVTGVIMAGRTGAAFAAHLGTMQVNEEIDALKTLGVSPMEFLVVPRMVALIVMMPLLCVYADLMGIVGGVIVSVGIPSISYTEYIVETRHAVTLIHFWIGLSQAVVFAALVALAGCLRGLQCGRSASAVGEAATSAVVTAIVAIVVATAIITFACNVLGI